MPCVTGLYIYPVKALRGYAVPSAEFDALGFVGDRRFLIVDANGKFLTQRTVPRMARIDAFLSTDSLTLSVENAGQLTVPRAARPNAFVRSVSVWKSENLQAEDCGESASSWLSDFLEMKCHLVRIGRDFRRPMLKSSARPGDSVSFADAYPFLILSEASLAALNDRLQEKDDEPVPMNRFRPSIVVDGCEAFAEDDWARVQIGDAIFRTGGPCARCIVTTTDQLTGERLGKEPLHTLATFRRNPADSGDVNFGINLIHETKTGRVQVGDTVVPL